MLQAVTRCYTVSYKLLHGVTSCHTVFNHVTRYYTVLNAVTCCYTMFHAVTQCYTLLHSVTRCYKLFHRVTSCYMVLQAVTWCLFFPPCSWSRSYMNYSKETSYLLIRFERSFLSQFDKFLTGVSAQYSQAYFVILQTNIILGIALQLK